MTELQYSATCLLSFSNNYAALCRACQRWVAALARREWDHPLECEPCLKVRYG